MKVFLFAVMLFVSTSLFSQYSFVSGYVVNLTGDTERVEIRVNPKKTLEQYQKVGYKMANGQQRQFKPDKVKGYGFGDNHFVSGKNDDENVFYKVLSDGELSLCQLQYETLLMNEITTKEEMYIKKTGDTDFHHLKHNKIKKQLKEHMASNNDLVKKLEEKDNLDQAEIVQVFNEYNSWAKNNKG